MSDRVTFTCDGAPVDLVPEPGETLLSVLRERLGVVAVKDGCAPQGQCGCCTVLVDGDPRVACVTPVTRVAGRDVTTVDGLDPDERDRLVGAFCATGGSQCGFCTPGILVRAAAALRRGRTAPADLDRALAAHLCRCTGWRTISEAIDRTATGARVPPRTRDLDAAGRRATLEGGVPQRVGPDVPLGHGGFADDTAPRGALVAVPCPARVDAEDVVDAAGLHWVVGASLHEARNRAGKVQGRRSTVEEQPPLTLPPRPSGGVRLATSWVEPAYLEPDASWCQPGGEAASPLANGGAFGGKEASVAPRAARELADRLGRPVRVVLAREDTVRLGPKRPPIAASAVLDGDVVRVVGVSVREPGARPAGPLAYRLSVDVGDWRVRDVPGPPVSTALRGVGWVEGAVLVEGALDAARADRAGLVADERSATALLDSCVRAPSGALAGARVVLDPERGTLERVVVRVAAGDPLDDVVLRSYAIGAAHMALGWVLTERLAVDPETGSVHDLTVRSFGVLRARHTPPIDVVVLDDPGPPLARASDAVFGAVAAAAWNALARVEETRPETFPARDTRAARFLRR